MEQADHVELYDMSQATLLGAYWLDSFPADHRECRHCTADEPLPQGWSRALLLGLALAAIAAGVLRVMRG
ncbi:hypothetical protein [Streptomyces sp. NBC_01304]|uniref:hypothetical protein n=1 Tax=Streptomyces sp. NBC_01304 TaxID=2903818 RepID=UPI002E105376|nr:hypothetical protein OG430_03415 [Streptomyces sp. NBC_01304]